MSKTQDLKHHASFDPWYHVVLTLILLISLVTAIVSVVLVPSFYRFWNVILALGAIVLLLRLRQYPLKVQDRLIRLEERLRLQALAPSEWHSQIYRLTEDQLIGLRFASDEEVVHLAKQALEENLTRKQIKERINNWRSDHYRV